MKKYTESFKFFFKVVLFLALLAASWLFVNLTSLVKDKRIADKGIGLDDLIKVGVANADAPAGGGESVVVESGVVENS